MWPSTNFTSTNSIDVAVLYWTLIPLNESITCQNGKVRSPDASGGILGCSLTHPLADEEIESMASVLPFFWAAAV